jgi:hypothetical protein
MSKKNTNKKGFPTRGAESEKARKAPSFLPPSSPSLSSVPLPLLPHRQQVHNTPRKQQEQRQRGRNNAGAGEHSGITAAAVMVAGWFHHGVY